jgi:FemAB-related protein (PEP-CTERM system-associated)
VALVCGAYSGTPANWDGFVRGVPGWTHFHLHGWKGVMERALGQACWYLAATDHDGQLRGVLPLVEVRSALFGHFLVSMPFVKYGGPLGSDEAVRLLVSHAAGLADARRADLLELRNRGPLAVTLPVSHRKITVLLDLPANDPESLWKSFDSKLRAQIRRPSKDGVAVRFGLDQIDPFYAVFSRHMRDLGTPTQGRPLFETLAATFPEDVWFACAYYRGRPVAAGCGFRWDREFEMTWASSLQGFSRLAPNMLLYWDTIRHCIASGVEVFNFGRCTPDSGTHRFKRQWGSRDSQLHWYQHRAGAVKATPSPTDGRYQWGTRLWKILPLAIATRLGPRIVRLIP